MVLSILSIVPSSIISPKIYFVIASQSQLEYTLCKAHPWNQLSDRKVSGPFPTPDGLWHQKFYHKCLRAVFLFLLFFPNRLAFRRAGIFSFLFLLP